MTILPYPTQYGILPELLKAYLEALNPWNDTFPDHPVTICSGYRSIERQRMIRQKFGYPNDDVPSGYHGLPLAARPGHSKHERGEAIDIHIKNGDFELYHKFFDFMVSVSTIQLWWLGPRDMGHIETKFQYPGGSGL